MIWSNVVVLEELSRTECDKRFCHAVDVNRNVAWRGRRHKYSSCANHRKLRCSAMGFQLFFSHLLPPDMGSLDRIRRNFSYPPTGCVISDIVSTWVGSALRAIYDDVNWAVVGERWNCACIVETICIWRIAVFSLLTTEVSWNLRVLSIKRNNF